MIKFVSNLQQLTFFLGLPSTIKHNRSSVDMKYIDINISLGRKDISVFGCFTQLIANFIGFTRCYLLSLESCVLQTEGYM